MLDVFVISILVTLVNLGSLAEITSGLAATFFCAVGGHDHAGGHVF